MTALGGAGGPVVAADIGGTTTRVAAVQGGRITRRLERPTPAAAGPEAVTAALLTLLGELDAPGPLGVACTGRVVDGQVSAVNTRTMPGWTAFPLAVRLREALGRPVRVLNDARAATWAEWNAAPTPGNFLFVTLSTGIGSGLVVGGRLLQADVGDTGLGFTRGLRSEALELGSSGTALGMLAAEHGYGTATALFDAAEAGDARATELLAPPLGAVAERLADLHAVLGLHAVCVGGSVGLRAYTRAVVAARLPETRVVAARYGADAGLIGAAQFALANIPGGNA